MTDGQKEAIKLRANYLNGLALAFAAAGGIGPAILMAYRLEPFWLVCAAFIAWAGGMSSWELHQVAMKEIRKLDG